MEDTRAPRTQPAELARIDRDYRRAATLTSARPKIVQLGLFLWFLLDVALIVFFFVTVVLYLVSGSFSDQRLLGTLDNNLASLTTTAEARAADPLLVGDPEVLVHDTGSYDVYAVIENPNTEWYATFTYMLSDGVMTEPRAVTVMPGEQYYATALGVALASRPAGVTITVDDVVWHRVPRHEIPNTAAFLAEHSDIVVADATYSTALSVEQTTVGDATFTLTNHTPYTYYNPTFLVLLTRGKAVVGINQVTVPQFVSGESRDVSVRWFGSVPSASGVTVSPVINYFDASEYAAPTGTPEADIRDTTGRRR